VPAPFVARFDRMLKVGRKGVAEVRHGTCAGCHLRLPAALTNRAKQDDDMQLCENCGAYRCFVPGEPEPEMPAARRRARKVTATPA
jgi:predicted  nucleic acid-binding Zn-ribbon protein